MYAACEGQVVICHRMMDIRLSRQIERINFIVLARPSAAGVRQCQPVVVQRMRSLPCGAYFSDTIKRL